MKKSEELKKLSQDLHDARMNMQTAEERLSQAEAAFDFFADSLDAVDPPAFVPPAKRTGGRKPGSKNKPKPTDATTQAPKQTDFNPAEFEKKETLVSLFDQHNWTSEERSHFITKQPDKSEHAMIRNFKEIYPDQ